MSTGATIAFGNCYICQRGFTFNLDRVPSVYVDPQTGKPPDVDPEPGGEDRARREPICEHCVGDMNTMRIELGMEPITVLRGAYEASTTW